MVKEQKKLWAHYEKIKSIIGYYISLFLTIPILSMCLSCLLHSKQIDAGIEGAIKVALLSGLKWYAIIISVFTVLFIIWFLFCSDRVELTDNSIVYYRWIFSKKSQSISYDEITECVFCDGLWWHNDEYIHGRKIWIYNKNIIIFEIGLYYKLCLSIVLALRDKKIQLVDDSLSLNTIDNYFKIDFMSLSYDQQLAILKYYCKITRTKYKTGDEILSKQKSQIP